MKILINIPSLKLQGGVANHYLGLQPYWTEEVFYNVIGKRSEHSNGTLWLPWDILKFVIKLIFLRPDIVVVNPSMGKRAIQRDFIFIKIAICFRKKIVVMFHGFHTTKVTGMEQSISKILNKCNLILVLAHSFKQLLEEWGVKTPIHTTTTKVDNRLIENFDITTRKGKVENILYLGRVTQDKGILISIQTFLLLHKKHPDLQFTVVGDGVELKVAKQMAMPLGNSIRFTGALQGPALIAEFQKADIYLFPSYHEGMPTSVLEAMCFGLPIITRPVGGLVDFFVDNKMGKIIDSDNPSLFSAAIEAMISEEKQLASISKYNYSFAKKHFLASEVTKELEKEYKE